MIVDTFYILDFDRCLGDTTKLQQELERAIERKTSINPEQLALARREVELSGGSFDAATYVQGVLKESKTSTTWSEICQDMISHARESDMLEPGAGELIDALRSHDEKFGILTYGGAEWQYTKLAAAHMEDLPVVITDDPGKGRIIASWKTSEDVFLIPKDLSGEEGMTARKIVLIDDKALSFRGIPSGVSGFHVLRSDRKVMPSQQGDLPDGVVRVDGLTKVIELLFSK